MNALYHHARKHPAGTAFFHEDIVWTYRDLVNRSEDVARGLLARGIRGGDRVLLHMSNRPEMVFALYACFRIGAIACPMNLRLKTVEARALVQRLDPAIYLGEEGLYSVVQSIEPDILAPENRFVTGQSEANEGAMAWSALTAEAYNGPMPPEPATATPTLLLTTSGTTGRPKLVAHTPGTLSAIAEGFRHQGMDAGQIVLNASPMVHGSGLSTFLAAVNFCAAVVLVAGFDPETVLDRIEAHRCTSLGGLPFMFHALLERQLQRPRKVDSLRHCISAGDVCPVQLQADFEATFGVPLRSVWGCTEASASFTYGLQPGTVSRRIPGVEVRLADDQDRAVAPGEVGELLVRGPNVTVGYWLGPDRVEEATTNGWFNTGDLMRQGAGDDLWFVGRMKDLIIRGGSNISPVEVERVLLGHPLVSDAAVFGVPDPVLGQRVAAMVRVAGAVDEAAIAGILTDTRGQLADYKAPEWLLTVDAVPRNPLGKIDRQALATQMAARLAA